MQREILAVALYLHYPMRFADLQSTLYIALLNFAFREPAHVNVLFEYDSLTLTTTLGTSTLIVLCPLVVVFTRTIFTKIYCRGHCFFSFHYC